MRRTWSWAAVAATMVAIGLLACRYSIAAADSAPPLIAQPDSRLLNPPVIDGARLRVAVAMRVINISEIDEVAQRYDVVGYLLADWKDPRLAFTPRAPWEKFRTYRPNQIWYPQFDFVNGVVPHSAHDVTIRAYPDGTVRYSERSSATLSNTFHLRTFPFDRQTLEILIHPSVAEDQMVDLTPAHRDAISAEPRVYDSLAQWSITGTSARVEQIPGLNGGPISEIRFTVKIVRRFNFYIWKVFLPLLLMVMLSWTVFWLDPAELSAQVEISVTTILTVIAFAFAIQANLPKVPYLTFIDVFFLTSYLFVFATAIEITAVHVAGRMGHAARARKLNSASRILLPLAFAMINLVMALTYFG